MISKHVAKIRNDPENIKKGHRYYRNKLNGYGKSIHSPLSIERSTKPGPLFQPDTRVFSGVKESPSNIEAFIEANGIKEYTRTGRLKAA